MGRIRRKFGGVGVCPAQNIPGKFYHRDLHSQTDTEKGNPVFSRVSDRPDHAVYSPFPKPAGNQDSVTCGENHGAVFLCHCLRIYPLDFYNGVIGGPRMAQRLHNGEIGVMKLRILANQRDSDVPVGVFFPLHHGFPRPQIRFRSFKS